MSTESIHSFAALHNRLEVRGTLVALTALRVGAGRSSEIATSDLPVLRDALGRPFIPGASLKGAFRARIEALVRSVAPDQALDLQEIEWWQREKIMKLIDDEELQEDRALSEAIWHNSTLIDQTFGAPWLASRIFFKDAQIDEQLWFGQFEPRNGVAINRDTETVHGGQLYDYEVVPVGMRFAFELVMENAEDWQLGMVLLALRPWERGEVQIGGFRSRGLGYVRLEETQRLFRTVTTVDDIIALLEDQSPTTNNVSDSQIKEWVKSFREVLIKKQRKQPTQEQQPNA